jgi:hypothetical protein
MRDLTSMCGNDFGFYEAAGGKIDTIGWETPACAGS